MFFNYTTYKLKIEINEKNVIVNMTNSGLKGSKSNKKKYAEIANFSVKNGFFSNLAKYFRERSQSKPYQRNFILYK